MLPLTTLVVASMLKDCHRYLERGCVTMKELICFSVGFGLGFLMAKRSQEFDELRRELDLEKRRNRSEREE